MSLEASYDVCFTPNQACEPMIVKLIDQAKQEVLVQAYSFTSKPIARALLRAKQRGINVSIILDSSQFTSKRYNSSRFFKRYRFNLWNDNQLNIAHNKVIIIDQKTLITGSYNFTWSAQHANAENLLILYNTPKLIQAYRQNWLLRQHASKLIAYVN